ncbi:type II toxin-antitoxin system RelE/ParE family toxin [Christiangramia fulva]|uniref:Type II toxin-antitoxin system RelE/ParE family toxin n=1 Tax=Christiangramia fulva TaxID=2126553 RepID=A0A2R3Z6T9_9FLAO|nr:type II toxin-antitoxin system RelE/ParE family toxin [Christiangramia fulva]AVR46007.1 type II toxin-antitoxin system RelE/ParE family toxin [Christiangramia fulva]
MEVKIYWTDFAKNEVRENFKYLKENASLRVARKETQKIVKETRRLKKQPEIGQIEELLSERKQEFRYLVHQSYKIIYWINKEKNQVEIVDIFDTQQHPIKIKRSK